MQQYLPSFGAVLPAIPASFLGTELDGRYRLNRLIGEGASAWVFAARDCRLAREVAVKLLKPPTVAGDAGRGRRFVDEGRILAKLVHSHVVPVFDVGETRAGLGYLVMELSEAGTLEAELFRRGALPVGEVLSLLLPLLGALAWAHDRGVVHRDIKPANIVLVRGAASTHAKLLDFGIAKLVNARTDSASGTPSYMAPEQARGEPAAPAVDVWAMGIVFFQCLSGRLPFEAANSLDGLMKLVHERAMRFAEACPGLGARLAVALDRALERDLERRYPDMRSFAHALVVASVQDGVVLSAGCEPLGLPHFDDWRLSADVEGTRTLLPAERAAIAVGPMCSLVPRVSRFRLAIAVGMLVVLAFAFELALLDTKQTATAAEPGSVPAAERGRAPHPILGDHVSALAASPAPAEGLPWPATAQSEPTRPAPAVAPASVPKPPPKRVARPRQASSLPSELTRKTTEEMAPAVPADAKPNVIKDWNW